MAGEEEGTQKVKAWQESEMQRYGRLEVQGLGLRCARMDDDIFRYAKCGFEITDIRISCTGNERGQFLVVIKGIAEGGKAIAFTSGSSPRQALIELLGALHAQSLRVKEDHGYGFRGPVPASGACE